MNKVYITDSQDKIEVTRALMGLVRRAVGKALKFEEVPFSAELSVTFTDNEEIKRLNSEYRNIDKETDVLSFPLYDAGEISFIDGKKAALGDIVISLERRKRRRRNTDIRLKERLRFLPFIRYFTCSGMTTRSRRMLKSRCSQDRKKYLKR